MLEELTVKNIALVESLVLGFSPGFNCLSGETGAGKSILAGALGLVRGNKGDTDLLRHGCDDGAVSAVFQVPPGHPAAAWLEERGLDLESGRVSLRRVLRRNGKAGIYIQGQSMTLRELTEFSGLLFDMHGQHEHQNLFDLEYQRGLLDRFGGLEGDLQDFLGVFVRVTGLRKRLEGLRSNEGNREARIAELEFGIAEIDGARISPGEDRQLEQERHLANQAERIYALCARAMEALGGEDGGGVGRIFAARQAVHDLALIDPGLAETSSRLDTLYYELEDLARVVQDYGDASSFDPNRIEEIEERLVALEKLKRKYGGSLEQVIQWREEAEVELGSLAGAEEDSGKVEEELEAAEKDLMQRAAALSQRRREAAQVLGRSVMSDLASLGMPKARFEISLSRKNTERGTPLCGPQGMDQVEFLLSANPGEPLRSIKAAASGGELSRIMLAIKNVLAASDQVRTLVFDEVDSGIGGEVAVAVADHIQKLSGHKQILAITHLASIAVRADNHIKVEKGVLDGRTLTKASRVTGADRVAEVARMLSGDTRSEASLTHAQDLLGRHHTSF